MGRVSLPAGGDRLVRLAAIISVLGAMSYGLTGCAAKKSATPVASSLPITSIPMKIQGQDWHIFTIVALGADPDTDRSVCLRFEGDRAVLEGVDQTCMFDGNHEKLLVNPLQRSITLAAASPQNSRTHSDGSIFFMCDIDEKNRQSYKDTNNVCVSRYSTADDVGKQILLTPLSGPAALFGKKLYVVKVDTAAIVSVVENAGVIPAAVAAERQTILARIAAAKSSKDLKRLSTFQNYLATEPDLGTALSQRLADLETAEAQVAAEQAQARQREAEKQQDMARRRAIEEEAEQKRLVAQNRNATDAFRKALKVGVETHCGLVLSINGPVAVVQAQAGIGQYGLKVSQLYPPGLAACRFYNGVYQDPGLPY